MLLLTFPGFALLRIFKTGVNKYTEKLERKNLIERKKIFTNVFRKSPSQAIAQNLCWAMVIYYGVTFISFAFLSLLNRLYISLSKYDTVTISQLLMIKSTFKSLISVVFPSSMYSA